MKARQSDKDGERHRSEPEQTMSNTPAPQQGGQQTAPQQQGQQQGTTQQQGQQPVFRDWAAI